MSVGVGRRRVQTNKKKQASKQASKLAARPRRPYCVVCVEFLDLDLDLLKIGLDF